MAPEKIRKIAKLLNLTRSSEVHEAMSAAKLAGEMVNGDFEAFFAQIALPEGEVKEAIARAYEQGYRDALTSKQQRSPADYEEVAELFREARKLKFTEVQAEWIVKLETAFKNQGNLSAKQINTLIDILRKGKK